MNVGERYVFPIPKTVGEVISVYTSSDLYYLCISITHNSSWKLGEKFLMSERSSGDLKILKNQNSPQEI